MAESGRGTGDACRVGRKREGGGPVGTGKRESVTGHVGAKGGRARLSRPVQPKWLEIGF
jgi:hypothetical protein